LLTTEATKHSELIALDWPLVWLLNIQSSLCRTHCAGLIASEHTEHIALRCYALWGIMTRGWQWIQRCIVVWHDKRWPSHLCPYHIRPLSVWSAWAEWKPGFCCGGGWRGARLLTLGELTL